MPKALVLGGYGLIGSACCRALVAEGFEVVGLGRSKRATRSVHSDVEWIIADLAALTTERWRDLLDSIDVVVNAAGALQDGPKDDLDAIHVQTMDRLCAVAEPELRFVQVSAAGVSLEALTPFFRSKAQGDAILSASPCDWVILRPTLVISSDAYGGTALLRGAAALPGILPRVLPESLVQTVHIDDLANAVVVAAKGQVPTGTVVDITAPEATPFPELLAKMRQWLGFADPRFQVSIPDWCLHLVGRCADGLGRLGWRSPLRSNALQALRESIQGDPGAWEALNGAPCRSLDTTLLSIPATRQERFFARLYFAVPFAIAILSAFWFLSGLLTLAFPRAAAAYLADSNMSSTAIWVLVFGGAIADVALGLAILWRPWCRVAALGMIGLACAYLVGGALTAPKLWADPLGPMIKVFPSIALGIIVWLGVEER